jgi:cardiolipin synthase
MQVDFVKSWLHLGGRIDQRGGTDAELKARLFPVPSHQGEASLQASVQIPGESAKIREDYLREIASANRSLYIENPYVTDRRIIRALEAASQRGVDVRLVVPGKNNHAVVGLEMRAQYDRLIRAGVRIYEYDGMTHAKLAARDGAWASIGSSNLDSLSMNHNYEFNYATTSPKVVGGIQNIVQADMAHSKEVHLGDMNPIGKWLTKLLLHNPFVGYFL